MKSEHLKTTSHSTWSLYALLAITLTSVLFLSAPSLSQDDRAPSPSKSEKKAPSSPDWASSRNLWRMMDYDRPLGHISYDGKTFTFLDNNSMLVSGVDLRPDFKASVSRATVLWLSPKTTFATYTADITATDDKAWVRIVLGKVMGGQNVRVNYAPDPAKKEKAEVVNFPAQEDIGVYLRLLDANNSEARQSGVLALRWIVVDSRRTLVVTKLSGRLKDPEPEVRAATAWTIAQLKLQEASVALQASANDEKDDDVKKIMQMAVGKMKR